MASLADRAEKLIAKASVEYVKKKSLRCSLCNLPKDRQEALDRLLAKRKEPNPPRWRDIVAVCNAIGIETSRCKLSDHYHDHYNGPTKKLK